MKSANPIPSASVLAQIAHLPALSMSELKALWRKLFRKDAPIYNRPFLERRLAYRLQEIEFRKRHAPVLERNQRRIAALIETGTLKKRDRDVRPVAGTLLVREYRGVEYRVVATAEGDYEFDGRRYGSLSRIATEITGTRWSGLVFFGLKSPKKVKGERR